MVEQFYNLVGLTGAVIVTYSNLPQIWLFLKQKHADGISLSSTWLGLVGVVLRTAFLMHKTKFDLLVLFPYYFGIACIIITLYYCYYPTRR